jgi:hypothetical protein
VRWRAEQPQENFLGEIFDAVAIASQAREGAKDRCLVLRDDTLEVLQVRKTGFRGDCFMFRRW